MNRKLASITVALTLVIAFSWPRQPVGSHAMAQTTPTLKSRFTTAAPTIDGKFQPAEWEQATTESFTFFMTNGVGQPGEIIPATLYLLNDQVNLYLGLQIFGVAYNNSTVAGTGSDILVLAFDNNDNGRVEPGEDQKFLTTFQTNISYAQRGGYVDSHVVTQGDGSDLRFDGLGRIVHSNVQGTGDYTAEFGLPLNSGDRQDIAVKLTDPIRFNLLLVTRCCEQSALEFGGLFGFELQDSRGWGVIRLESGLARPDPPVKLLGTVAFITREFGAGRQIYAMNADGTNRRQLTSGNRVVNDPSLSPDGQTLVYTAALPDRPETQEIFTTSTRVAYPQQLTNNSVAEANPVFSPDGQRIVYVREGNIWVMNARGGGQKQLTNAGADGEPAWTPDGRIVFHTGRFGSSLQIAIMNADGSNITPVTRSEKNSLSPQVSPDGQWVTFFRYDGAGAFYEFGNSLFQPWNIYRIRVNGTEEQRLTDDGLVNFVPTFSADGQGIFYQKLLDPNSFYSVLYYLDLKSGATRRVLDAVSRVEAFDWR